MTHEVVDSEELDRRRTADHGEPDSIIRGEMHNKMVFAEAIAYDLLTYRSVWSFGELRNAIYADPRWIDVASTCITMGLRRMERDGGIDVGDDGTVSLP